MAGSASPGVDLFPRGSNTLRGETPAMPRIGLLTG